jgi:hypothetical protein
MPKFNDNNSDSVTFHKQPHTQQPRILSSTKQCWQYSNGSEIFNTPIETGRLLDSCQGKVDGFKGTCGLVSCVNVLRLAGVDISEADIVLYASTHKSSVTKDYLCTVNKKSAEKNGGTYYSDRQEILKHFGIHSIVQDATVDNIAEAVIEGKGVIVSVDAGRLYEDKRLKRYSHAITVTSVSKLNGLIEGFFVCDSGRNGIDGSKYYKVEEIMRAVKGKINVTSNIIR